MICQSCGQLVGALTFDAEFHLATRDGRVLPLGEAEFRALKTLAEAKRPVYSDYLAEVIDARTPNALFRTVHRLRLKLKTLGLMLVTTRRTSSSGEPSAYSLTAYVCGDAPLRAETPRRAA